MFDSLATTFDLLVVGPTEIKVTELPFKTEYIEGDTLNLDGGWLAVLYNNETSDTISLALAKVVGFDGTKVGIQSLSVVMFDSLTTTFDVTIRAKNPFTKPELIDGFYQISNAEELLWFMFDVNSGDVNANAQLTQDIVINAECLKRLAEIAKLSKSSEEDLTVWQPIGTLLNAFSGIFDGQGHSISGIYIDDKTQENVGLFGVTAPDAVIKNLGVTDSYIAGKDNVGAIVGDNAGVVVNCYSTATVVSEQDAQNVSGIAGKVAEKAVVENSYYLASEAKSDDPQAKTAADFKNGDVAKLLAEGATVNGEKIGGESFAGVVDLPGTEDLDDPTTPTSELAFDSDIRIWSFEKTIYVENPGKEIRIIEMSGRLVKTIKADSDCMEIPMQKSGIYIVKTGARTQKVMIR
jgi:hypothetical protein